MVSGFGLKPPVSGFQFYSYSSLKTSSVTSKVVLSVLASVFSPFAFEVMGLYAMIFIF